VGKWPSEIDHAADRGEISPVLDLVTCRPTFVTPPTILVAGNNRVIVGMNSLHSLRTECRSECADAAKQDFDVQTSRSVWIATRNFGGTPMAMLHCSGISFRIVM